MWFSMESSRLGVCCTLKHDNIMLQPIRYIQNATQTTNKSAGHGFKFVIETEQGMDTVLAVVKYIAAMTGNTLFPGL